MSDDFAASVGKAAVKEAGAKFSCKDINFKEPRTWGWIIGLIASIGLILSSFSALIYCPVPGLLAFFFGAALAFLEFFCCFKCCASTKACVTKTEPMMTNPFMKGGAYIVLGTIGLVVSVLPTCTNPQIGVIILFIFCIAAGICYVVFGFVERAKNGGGGGGAGTPSGSKSTTYSDGAPSEPDFSQA
mmetsp:Transcript_34313/g.50449  ORF Transcript_34313/g.50449 Transcript_34313/m.50449 type:complete len:187 (+) Transcript_34313:56-616(+)|eukprot:CAMPEP_0195518716 /NCGR_PEP_ID=MMETSP0794_2-20130614/13555_1 /TAXON_ID=515487 /ORGANISM="Stephanopyxis turris, Strain CCMP 815" /LENGTH=186 /DNA_ID=CAMNT_0040647737 /DNA_START=56 /DNA_END=616 /DNA_ORIENTATION=-